MAVLFLVSLALVIASLSWQAITWWRQKKFQAFMRKQGVRGSPPVWIHGNILQQFKLREGTRMKGMKSISHDIVSQVTPEVTFYSSLYNGKPYFTWWFSTPRITLFDPDSIKEVMSKQFNNFHKSKLELEFILDLIGRGLVGVNGDEWFHRRNGLSPAFHTQKIKSMVLSVQSCTSKLIESWTSCVTHGQTEVEIFSAMKILTADIISHTAFGSSYAKGERVFQGLTVLGDLLTKRYHFSWIPFFRYLPAPLNFQIRKLRREIDGTLLSLIHERRSSFRSGAALSYGNDLLGTMLEESEKPSNKSQFFGDQVLVDECKTFYLAGHETTTSLITWTLLLIAINPDWQERARAEVQEHCSDNFEDGEVLSRLKVLTMILYETLRLYPPVSETLRTTIKDTDLNGLKIPGGTGVIIPILSLHHNKELWGEDANEFNPERFAHGAARASKHPNAFLPFILGPRVCIGQAFAFMEAKVVLALLLQKFLIRVSPGYRHNPTVQLVIVPTHGMHLLLESI